MCFSGLITFLLFLRLMENRLKFAISGCGNIALRHATAAAHFGELIGVCDTDEFKTGKFVEWFDCNAYHNLEDMLSGEPDIDIVCICSPNYLHASQSITCMEKGFHVLCEKPMAINISDAVKMVETSKQTGKELFIVKQMRHYPSISFIKDLISKGALGKIFSVHTSCFWNRPADYYQDWKGSKDKDGGTLFTQFSHYIDLLLWLFGSVEKAGLISANRAHPKIEFEDVGMINLVFHSGAVGSFNYTVNAPQKTVDNSLNIFAEKGSIKLNGSMLENFEYFNVEGVERPPEEKGNILNKEQSHFKVYENVIRALTEQAHEVLKAEKSIESIRLIEELYQTTQ